MVVAIVVAGNGATAWPQALPTTRVPAPEWRKIGSTVVGRGLASPAGGAVDRVWYSDSGRGLFVRTGSQEVWRTRDLETWTRIAGAAPPPFDAAAFPLPEAGARTASSRVRASRLYAVGAYAYRSDDGGRHWENVTQFRQHSIVGRLVDVAVSPANADEVTVVGEYGVWRSADGGTTWLGLNDGLPNLPVSRLLATPDAGGATRIALSDGDEATWSAGERSVWQISDNASLQAEQTARTLASASTRASITAIARSNTTQYAGSGDGRIFASLDGGVTWRESPPVIGSGGVLRLAADRDDGNFAVASTSATERSRVLRTQNGGLFWDDVTGDLPAGAVSGIAFDRSSGAVYAAAERGLYMAYVDSVSAAQGTTTWTLLRAGRAVDVMLDGGSNQLYAAFDGAGVYATMAPHRIRDPRVVSAADRVARAAAPGALLSVIGARLTGAKIGNMVAPVLAAAPEESQVQVPFEVTGSQLALSMDSSAGPVDVGVPLKATAPAIFVDPDGGALVMNGDTGLMLDAGTPARSGMRLQILATGLGRVSPNWPSGLAAPLDDPPRVIAPVRVYIDREPVELIRATLAPGYTGMYLVEIRLPSIVNQGSSELYIETDAQASNRVRIWLEP